MPRESQVQQAAAPRGSGSASGVTLENVHECPGLLDAIGCRGHSLSYYLETNILPGAIKAQQHSTLTSELTLMRVTEPVSGTQPNCLCGQTIGSGAGKHREWLRNLGLHLACASVLMKTHLQPEALPAHTIHIHPIQKNNPSKPLAR